MSEVTDIILITFIGDGAEKDGEHPNADILWTRLKKVDDLAGGNKCMQCDVFMAAENHLDQQAFLKRFHAVKWESPERVQLLLKGEHDERFTLYHPGFPRT